jgi:hypothetical protein
MLSGASALSLVDGRMVGDNPATRIKLCFRAGGYRANRATYRATVALYAERHKCSDCKGLWHPGRVPGHMANSFLTLIRKCGFRMFERAGKPVR